MSRIFGTRRLVLLATSAALAAGGAMLPATAFASTPPAHTATMRADAHHGDHKNKHWDDHDHHGKDKDHDHGKHKGDKNKPKKIKNMPGCHFYKGEVFCKQPPPK